jgi:glycosyltransferase involved in cell wall biosynthesis
MSRNKVPKISVVLVVKNALPFVSGALDSLRKQTFTDFEVVVADGGSSDGTLEALREAAKSVPLAIVSESDRSLADGMAKALRHVNGEILATLCADERYYPNTLERVAKWFEDDPDAVMCAGNVDFLDEHDDVVDNYLTRPFNLSAQLSCEVVPSILSSFFNRRLVGDDLRFASDVPTCPDYEFWGRLGARFPEQAFRRYDFSVAQAYRTDASMSFRAESYRQFCKDKLAYLNSLIDKGYVTGDIEQIRRRASAGIHMWAAEQLRYIQHDHPDILAHCAAAARFDKSYDRITRFIAMSSRGQYDPSIGAVIRTATDRPGSHSIVAGQFEEMVCHPYWAGAAVLSVAPLVFRTAIEAWGYALELPLPRSGLASRQKSGQYWARLEVEIVKGAAGIGLLSKDSSWIGEQIIRESDGRIEVCIPMPRGLFPSVVVRSGGVPSSVVRIHQAQLLFDPVSETTVAIAPIDPADLRVGGNSSLDLDLQRKKEENS